MKLLLLSLLFFSSLFANKVLYSKYEEIPHRVVKGEIFNITLKTLSTVKNYDDIKYKFKDYTGLKILNKIPHRKYSGKYILDKFYFLTTRTTANLPTIEISLVADQEYETTTLLGERLNVISLNPKRDFSNIIANSLELVEYKTTAYDKHNNIIVFVAKATNTTIESMQFKNVSKQGIESSKKSYLESRITYFVVVDKKVENFSFSYFNLVKNRFLLVNIPIIVDDDSVTTQSDLKPKDQSHDRLKAIIAAIVAVIIFIFILIRKKYIYLILILIPIGYIIYITIPSKEICIKEGSQIHLLPVDNGTIFETTSSEYHLLQEGKVKGFIKVKLQNEKIGWVKNEDTCSR